MKDRVNSFVGILFVIVTGAGAAWLIVHFATTGTLITTVGGTEANYAPLQKSILGQ